MLYIQTLTEKRLAPKSFHFIRWCGITRSFGNFVALASRNHCSGSATAAVAALQWQPWRCVIVSSSFSPLCEDFLPTFPAVSFTHCRNIDVQGLPSSSSSSLSFHRYRECNFNQVIPVLHALCSSILKRVHLLENRCKRNKCTICWVARILPTLEDSWLRMQRRSNLSIRWN